MFLMGSRASRMIMLVCTLALLMETVRGGSSFLSPTQKPPGKGDRKPPRLGRRVAVQPDTPQEYGHTLVSPPFQLGLTLTEAEFAEHGSALQRILDSILGDTASE
ncbi:ghrelin/obestatin prepropeptide isoform X1 [Alosa alosa]|uniref:ghrelin/obestatin prepropeptide isoform X1 n=1 Tax=Alosa alosa TaxID=278164 RepID=UPI0020150A52|nr:ghrelin/obestatin prepropeptide isoform X1 [Alosa alosa]